MENTIENNKLIAEFMELLEYNSSEYLFNDTHIRNKTDLDYHKSWDWLMPVVEKIEKLGYAIRFYWNGGVNKNVCFIEKTLHDYNYIGLGESDSKIQATYNAVVELIKWYNEQKK